MLSRSSAQPMSTALKTANFISEQCLFPDESRSFGSRTGSGAFRHVPLNWFLPENHCFLDVHFLQNCHSRIKNKMTTKNFTRDDYF